MTPQNMKFDLIIIEWCDAIENSKGWNTLEEAIEWSKSDDWKVTQVGWLLDETKEHILIASMVNNANEYRGESFSGLMKIPKTWIKSRKKLKTS